MKNLLPLSLYFCLCMAMFAGCNKPNTNAADSIKAIYDLYILGDTRAISSLGMTDEDIASAQKTYDDSLREMIRANFSDSGQEIDDDTLDELCAARKEALAEMSASAEVTEETDGTATVVVHTTYFKESALDADAFYDAREEALRLAFTDPTEQQVFLMNAYTRNLIAAYRNVTPSTDTTDITVECVIQNKTWVPANMSSFGSDLALAITGHH
ncbi:MAG: hypothetical protein HFI69_11205 [Lachnospiraceae bacterium]|nr:hypothetical protein [Lachnospiraceae bacterium]